VSIMNQPQQSTLEAADGESVAAPSLIDAMGEVVFLNASSIRTRRWLSPDEEVFAGHYPHHPVFPGVLLLEGAIQATRVFAARLGGQARLADLQSLRFHQALYPRDCYALDIAFSRDGRRLEARVTVVSGGRSVATARLAFYYEAGSC
jgi:3-hydroxyacyl-[acyl-carrier-protein] dehydratase